MPQFISSPPESLVWHELATPCTPVRTPYHRTVYVYALVPYILYWTPSHPVPYTPYRTLYPGAGLPFYVLRSSVSFRSS